LSILQTTTILIGQAKFQEFIAVISAKFLVIAKGITVGSVNQPYNQ
jgi:hypothetical protein